MKMRGGVKGKLHKCYEKTVQVARKIALKIWQEVQESPMKKYGKKCKKVQ